MQRTVTLVRGSVEIELSLQQVNVQSLQRIFQLEPTSIWLKEDIGNRALFPEPDGSFNMDSVVYYSFRVEGVVLSALPTGVSDRDGPTTSSVNVRTPSGPPIFRSVAAHRSRRSDSLSAEPQPTARVKIIKANLLTDTRGSATMQHLSQLFIEVNDSTANVPYLLQAVKDNFGAGYILVTANGLEIEEGSGTTGLRFWKAPNRKVFAVLNDQVARTMSAVSAPRKRRMLDVGELDERTDPSAAANIRFDDIEETLGSMNKRLETLFSVSSSAKLPLGIAATILTAFKCKICHSLMKPPVIASKCCRSLLGCQRCVDEWYGGSEGISRSCLNCRRDRGYSETFIIVGLDEFLTSVQPLFSDEGQPVQPLSLDN